MAACSLTHATLLRACVSLAAQEGMLTLRASGASLLLLLSLVLTAHAEVQYDAIRSTRGVQHKQPIVSDDFVVACIMVMFLLLFCFGKQ